MGGEIPHKITKKEAFRFIPKGHTGVINWEMIGPKTSSAKKISVWIGESSAGAVAEPHTHEVEEQAYYVLEGSLRIIIGEQEFEAQGGDGTLYFMPPKTPHAVYTLSPHAKVIIITSPAMPVG